jgi:hypothetical protein
MQAAARPGIRHDANPYMTKFMAPTFYWAAIPLYPTTNPSTTGYVDNFSRPTWCTLGRTGAGVGLGMPGITVYAYDDAGTVLYNAGSGADPGHDFYWVSNAALASTAVPVAGWKMVKTSDSSLIAVWGKVPGF